VFALEFKATRRYRPKSTSRIVLTSSSGKIRRLFRAPVCHFLVTICYGRSGGRGWVTEARLGFLQPDTRVNVRLEASVNRRLLSNNSGDSKWLGRPQEQ
jgi:hypothetical protein